MGNAEGVVFTDLFDEDVIVEIDGVIYRGTGGEEDSKLKGNRTREIQTIR
ncbi:hypothetical protein [Virgibacillus salexigens]|nr:hypothetical protein [Virgibacillus salexigens]